MKGIARYTELEPIVYELFGKGDDLDIEEATKYIHTHYYESLSSNSGLVAFESTGVVQRPLLLDVMAQFDVALVRVDTPKEICLARVAKRNLGNPRPIELDNAAEFYDYWMTEIAPTYDFALTVDGTNEESATHSIRMLMEIERRIE